MFCLRSFKLYSNVFISQSSVLDSFSNEPDLGRVGVHTAPHSAGCPSGSVAPGKSQTPPGCAAAQRLRGHCAVPEQASIKGSDPQEPEATNSSD